MPATHSKFYDAWICQKCGVKRKTKQAMANHLKKCNNDAEIDFEERVKILSEWADKIEKAHKGNLIKTGDLPEQVKNEEIKLWHKIEDIIKLIIERINSLNKIAKFYKMTRVKISYTFDPPLPKVK